MTITTDIVISSPASPFRDYALWPVQIQDSVLKLITFLNAYPRSWSLNIILK
jgi:hypothetical protein